MTTDSSDIVAILEPIHHENESLMTGIVTRPFIKIRRNDFPLCLGRNSTTGIHFPQLSKKAATVKWKNDNGVLFLERHSSHVSVISKNDGSVVPLSKRLSHGDVVRLYKQEYAYRIKLCNNETENDNTTTDNKDDVLLAEECMCPVCMEIMVQTTAVAPCGHLFCKECLEKLSTCPNCRLNIQMKLANKTFDNVISSLVKKKVFSDTDTQHYWTRVKPPTPPTVVLEAPSPPKRARRTHHPTVISVDLTGPDVGDTADDAICID